MNIPKKGTAKSLVDLSQTIVTLPDEVEMPKAVLWFIRDYMKQKFAVALTKAHIVDQPETVAAIKELYTKLTQEDL